MTHTDPYKILGVARNATLPQVKTRYFELARKHHPDKLGDVSTEERCRNEELFKEVTSAYSAIEHRIKTGICDDSAYPYFSGAGVGGEDWRSVWNEIESLFQNPGTWETMINIVKNTVADVTVKGVKKLRTHHIKIPVSLEEVHSKKKKRVRLFLAEMEEPIFTTIDIGEYPIMDIQHPDSNIPGLMIKIAVTMELSTHPMYRLDDVLDSWDLFAEIHVTWVDFLCGRKITLPYIDGTSVDIDIRPFKDYTELPIVFADKGLCGLGNMYVAIKMQPPSCDASVWNALPARERSSVVDTFRTLYEPTTRV